MHGDPTNSANHHLRRYLAAEEDESTRELEILIERFARPVVVRTVRGRLRMLGRAGFFSPTHDIEDIFGDSCLRLVARLRSLRERSDAEPIDDFENYSAVVALNSVNDFLKANSPKRVSLRNRVRYVIEKLPRFVVEKEGTESRVCLRDDNGFRAKIGPDEIVQRLRGTSYENLADQLETILEEAGGGLRLNDLARIVADLEGIDDAPPVALDDWHETGITNDVSAEIERRFELASLWNEIVKLPGRQRVALLYNLVDEKRHEMLFMFFNARIAGLAQIARALDVTVEECAELLPRLPLEDKKIASIMDLTPKQVANLRKVARQNLRRRLAGTPRRQRRETES